MYSIPQIVANKREVVFRELSSESNGPVPLKLHSKRGTACQASPDVLMACHNLVLASPRAGKAGEPAREFQLKCQSPEFAHS